MRMRHRTPLRTCSAKPALSGAGADPGATVAPELRDKERTLWVELGRIQSDMSRTLASEDWSRARLDSLEALRKEVTRDYRASTEEISARSPMYGIVAGQRPPLTVQDVRARVLAPSGI